MRFHIISRLTPAEVDQAFALIQLEAPELSLAAWRQFLAFTLHDALNNPLGYYFGAGLGGLLDDRLDHIFVVIQLRIVKQRGKWLG